MMHWKATICGLALSLAALVLAGCSQPCCLHEYDEFTGRAGLPPTLANDPCISNQLTTPNPMHAPTTINDLEREPNYITLSECIALALENGCVGIQSVNSIFNSLNITSSGFALSAIINDLVTFNGTQAVGSDSIRVFALQPAIAMADIEGSLARYDVVARTILGFNTEDQNPNGPNGFRNGNFTAFGTSLEKSLPTGGLANITFGSPTNQGTNPGTNFYNNFASRNTFTGLVNGYTPDLSLSFTQPLLRGFGTDINSLLTQLPIPSGGAQTYTPISSPPIAITRINFNQSRAEFERLVNYMVLNVETAYYVLYGSYVNLYSTQKAMEQSYAVWKISKAKYEAGSIPITEFAQTRTQYEDFRAQRLNAVNNILEKERALRVLCGLPVEDGHRLIPVDTPTVQQFVPDWCSALQESLALRPELVIAREDVKRRQMELIREKNGLLPDVRLETNYTVSGFGTRLDGDGVLNGAQGPQTNNAFHDLAGGHYGQGNIGINASVPLGYRAQYAALQQDQWRLMQAYLVLRDQENKARNVLTVAYRALAADYEIVRARRAQREAAAEQVEARYKEFIAGKKTVDFLLTAQQQWASALSQEYQIIATYNFDIALFQFAKGTLLAHDNIEIAENGLPQCIQVRAVENERQRAKALVLREQAAPLPHNVCCPESGGLGMPAMPHDSVPSLPALMGDQKLGMPNGGGPLPAIEANPSPSARPMQSQNNTVPLTPAVNPPAPPASTGVVTPPMAPALDVFIPADAR